MGYFAPPPPRGTNEPVMWLDWHSSWDFWYYVIWLPPYTHLDWHSRWRFYLMWYEWNNCTTWYNILPWLALYHGAPVYSFAAMNTGLTKTKDKNLERDMMNELTRLSVVKTWVNQLLSYSWFWKNKFGKIFQKDMYADISKESCGSLSIIDEPSPVVSCRHKFFLHWINGEMAFRANN